jgi:hypothetical protein
MISCCVAGTRSKVQQAQSKIPLYPPLQKGEAGGFMFSFSFRSDFRFFQWSPVSDHYLFTAA